MPNLARILDNYWRRKRIVPKVVTYLDTAFVTGVVVTQGDPASPIIFKIVMAAVLRAVLEEVFSPQEAQHGMGWEAGERNLVFYTDDRSIAGQDHEWVQDALTVAVAMF